MFIQNSTLMQLQVKLTKLDVCNFAKFVVQGLK